MKKKTRLGPRPWRPAEGTDQPPAERVLAALAEQVGPVTTPDLVRAVGLHANTVRAHLQELVAAGLVAVESVPPSGRGRPAHQYVITEAGRTVPRVNDPAFAEYRGLTSAFAGHLAEHSERPSVEARQIGQSWGRQLARGESGGQGPVSLVVRLLSRLGFSPVPPPEDEDLDAGVALRTCPLLELAEEMPEVICQVHQGLVEGALDQYGSGRPRVELLPFSEPGACRLHLRAAGAGRSDPTSREAAR